MDNSIRIKRDINNTSLGNNKGNNSQKKRKFTPDDEKVIPGIYYRLNNKKIIKKIIHPKSIEFCKRDERLINLHPILVCIAKNGRKSMNENSDKNYDIIKELEKIIPMEYFGCWKNKKLFRKIIQKLMTKAKHECLYKIQLIQNFQLTKIPWLEKLKDEKKLSEKYLYEANDWIIKRVICPIIRKMYRSAPGSDPYEIRQVPAAVMKSFNDKLSNSLSSILVPVQTSLPVIGELEFIPKGPVIDSRSYRPIARILDRSDYYKMERLKMKLKALAKSLRGGDNHNFYTSWKQYVKNTTGKQIYGVVLDIQDAFTNVNLDILGAIIKNTHRLTQDEKREVMQFIDNQLVYLASDTTKIDRKVWRWCRGLLQGPKLSPILCEIYLSYMDSIHLKEFKEKPCCFMKRSVDDFLFCSTNKEDVKKFKDCLFNQYPINRKKIQCSVEDIHFGENFTSQIELKYNGCMIDMNTKEIKFAYTFQRNYCLQNRFMFWNISFELGPHDLIKRSLSYCANNFFFNKIFVNLDYNSRETALQNYFNAFTLLAYKFDFILKSTGIVVYQDEIFDIIKKTITIFSACSMKNKNSNEEVIPRMKVSAIGYLAFYKVLKRRKVAYKYIIKSVEERAGPVLDDEDLDLERICSHEIKFRNIAMRRVFKQYDGSQ